MCKSTKCQSKCKVPCQSFNVNEIDPDVATFYKLMGKDPNDKIEILAENSDEPMMTFTRKDNPEAFEIFSEESSTLGKFYTVSPPKREQFLEGTTPMSEETAALLEQDLKETRGYDELPPYYDNSKGSLYHIAEQRGWGVRLFDLVKRLERGGKKYPLKQEIEKSIGVLQLWLKELED